MRIKDIRGNPEIKTDLHEIERYFPMQVELGCGPSIEAGIPPLHYLHTLYQVSEPIKGNFIFGPDKDTFISDFVNNPKDFLKRSSKLYLNALTTKTTPFYQLLKHLNQKNIVVGDIITNNFDGICTLIGLNEKFVRRFEEQQVVPIINFHPQARSLLVIGVHADRRRVEKQAREKGMKIIYIDPEGYIDQNNSFTPYPLESIQDNDILFHLTAQQFTDLWKNTFKDKTTF